MNKRLHWILLWSFFLISGGMYSREDKGTIGIINNSVVQRGERIYFDFNIVLDELRLPSNEQLVLTPVVDNGAGNRLELPGVIINGRRRDNLYKRMDLLGGSSPVVNQTVKADSKRFSTSVRYVGDAPYSDWMDGSQVYVLTDACGCGGVSVAETDQLDGFMIPSAPAFAYTYTPRVQFTAPAREEIKKRAESGSAYVIFPVNQTVIYPDLANNREELGKVQKSLRYIREESTATITGIHIEAYASPEGGYENNLRLSRGRADALRIYVERTENISKGIMRSEGMGENWKGLIAFVTQDSTLILQEEILQIIRNTEDISLRKRDLMRLSGGKPYRYMLKEFYPWLRRSDYRIEYTLPEFTLEKSKELLHSKPEMLSLAELYHIANTYETGSPEFIEIFELAARQYPEDVIANLNFAALSLLASDYDSARAALELHGSHPGAWNNLGVLLMNDHRFDEAESYLRRAKESGSDQAEANLSILYELKQAVLEYEAEKAVYDRYKQQ